MALLKVEDAVLPNENGKVKPQQIELEGNNKNEKEEVKVYPLTDEEFGNIASNEDEKKQQQSINEMIANKLVEPEIDKERVKLLKPTYKALIFKAILRASGIDEEFIKQTNLTKNENS